MSTIVEDLCGMAELERAMARETTYDMRPVNEEMMTLDDDDAGPCSCCGKV